MYIQGMYSCSSINYTHIRETGLFTSGSSPKQLLSNHSSVSSSNSPISGGCVCDTHICHMLHMFCAI